MGRIRLITVFVMFLASFAEQLVQLRGQGASFPSAAYRLVFQDWNLQQTDSEASYIPSGSGIGIELFELSEIEFAGSDIVLNESVYEDYPTFQLLPSVVGAIAISYNVPLLRNKLLPLVLDAETTAQIFAGEIRRWNDPRLIARNPDLNSSSLDDIDIILLLRDGSSGTTQQFTSYLNSAAPETWKYGSPSTFPVTMLSEKGVKFSLVSSQDMLAQTISVDYSISYQSYANLLSVGPFVAHMINRAGNQVSPSVASVLAAEQSATFTPYLTASLVNLDAKEAWPISMYSYFLIDRGDCQTTHSLLSMFNWFYTAEEVQVYLEVSGFSLANRTKERVLSIIRGVTCNGRLVLKETLFDGREDFIMLFLFGSVYVIFSILSILAVYQHVTKHSKEPLFSKVTSIICAFLLNVSPVPYFFSPTDLVCTSRVLLLISWIVLVAFFSSRASLLYTLDQYDKANNLSGILSICEEAKHCHNPRSLVAYCWVALNICYLVTWVMFFNVRAESILDDPVAYSANIFCTSDYFTELLLLQLSLISVLSLNVVRRLLVVSSNPNLNTVESQPLLISTVNLVNSLLLMCAYWAGLNFTDKDVLSLALAVILTCCGFGPLLFALVRFKPSRLFADPDLPSSSNESRSFLRFSFFQNLRDYFAVAAEGSGSSPAISSTTSLLQNRG